MKGLVLKSTGSNYKVKVEPNIIDAKLSGKLRLDLSKHTNPVAVGDIVLVDEDGMIQKVEERKNYLIRKSTNLSKQTHIIAANIDQILILASLKQPRTSNGFIDRIICTAEAYSITPVIIFNKKDLLDSDELELVEAYKTIYNKIGYDCYIISSLEKTDLNIIKSVIKNKITLFTGHSGVGKSTMMNALDNNLTITTGEISNKHEKGKHTTTFAEMYELDFGGYIIDTPGIKEFGMVDMDKYEVTDYFREFFQLKSQCKFNNCLHVNEPGCAIIEAVKNDDIAEFRYTNYINILESL